MFQFELSYGYDHPQCMDCRGCFGRTIECEGGRFHIKHIVVEFSKDRTMQSTQARTSQQAVVEYMLWNLDPTPASKNWIFFSAGLHDSSYGPNQHIFSQFYESI